MDPKPLRKKSSIKSMLGMKEPPPVQNEPEEEYPEDTDRPEALPIFHRNQFSKQLSDKGKKEDSSSTISSSGKLKYDETMDLLTCKICNQLVKIPFIQCRKGHMYCRECKVENKVVQCKICKQTFVDAPNLAMEQLVSFIAVPCKYSERGCEEFVFVPSRLQHETLCKYRPVNCQFQERGCTQVYSLKDMCWHHKMCSYANYPYPNVLPNMPTRSKSKGAMATATTNGKSSTAATQNGFGDDHSEEA